jgi:diguanylate cyclase (GGDEF)-like protein
MSDTADTRISRFTAEFVDSGVELAFRAACHHVVVRDTRFAFGFAVLFCMLLAVTDYLSLGPGEAFYALLISRIVSSVFALAVMLSAARFWRALMDGITPTLIEVVLLVGFLSMTLLRPYEPGWHGMSMMLILLGLYVFVPNRFLLMLGLGLSSTLAFVWLLDAHFQLPTRQILNLAVLLAATNLFGARAAYRNSRHMREEYRAAEHHRLTQEALAQEGELRARLQTERDALAQSDVLTGTVNRRYFHTLVEHATHAQPGAETLAEAAPESLLVLEVDYLKQLNDTYGHHNSEAVLKHLVTVCQRVLRRSDSLARLGEATFATLLLDTDCRAGRQLAERLRAELHRVPLRLPTAAVYINASIGLTQWRAGDSTESFMQRADAALALAKANGGNRVELAA